MSFRNRFKVVLAILFCSALLIIFSVPVTRALNKVANWGFESAIEPGTNWTETTITLTATQDSFTRSQDQFQEGINSFYGYWHGTASNQVATKTLTQNFTPTANVNARLRAYYRRNSSGGTADNFTLIVSLKQGAATLATAVNVTNIGTDSAWQGGTWTSVVSLTSGITYTVEIYWSTQVDNGDFQGAYVDNIQLSVSPQNLAAIPAAGTTNVSLNWTAGSGSPGLRGTNPYQVYKGTTSGGETPLAFSSTNSYTDSTTSGNTTYYYQVTDFDTNAVESPRSTEVSVLTNPAAPGTPTFPGFTDTSITVNWTASPGGASSYKVERAPDVTGVPGLWAEVASGVTSPWTDNNLACETTYWYRVRGTNGSGSGPYSANASKTTGTCPVPIPPVTTGTASAVANTCNRITVSAPYTGDTDGDSRTSFDRGTTDTGPWSIVCSNVAGASPRSCVDNGVSASSTYYYRVTFTDPDGINGTNPQVIGPYTTPACVDTTVLSSSASVDSCNQITTSSPFIGDSDDDGSTQVEYNTSNTWPGTTACATLTGSSARQCRITGLSASTNYWIRVTWTDPDGVTGTNPEVLGPYATPACGPDTASPTVLILSPTRDAILGGTDKVKIQVFEKVGLALITPVKWSVDGGSLSTSVTLNSNYNCGQNCSVYEFDLNTTTLTNAPHYITVQVTDAAGNIATTNWPLKVYNKGTVPGGSGTLLRRTYGAQLCIDCHNLPTHSSHTTSTQYGNWAIDCQTCHMPHGTRNLFLVRESIRTPNSGKSTVVFQVDDKPGNTNPNNSYLGTNPGLSPYNDGVCEACHTQTLYHRNSAAADHTHNQSTRCMKCHGHRVGFAPGGGDCRGCHGTTTQGGRRAVDADFSKQSHHVGNGSTMGGALTNFDCAVCHAEGTVLTGPPADTDTTEYHRNGVIDLKDADNIGTVYSYDKDTIPGAASTWNSGNATWVTETSTHLDPFCLSCHDTNGATQSFAGDGGTASALNPFGDTTVTNNYDQVSRTRVVDIKSRVKDNSPNGDGNCGIPPAAGCADRDQSGEARYDAAPIGPDGIADPPQGIYSRHAIRGQSVSVYKTTTANWNSTPYWTSSSWNSTSVMGCADCHTVDGANTTNGNAHGSNSEYLLKDASGGATEGNSATTYVCAQCHNSGWYEPNNHTTNGNNFQDYTSQTGSARVPTGNSGGNIYGLACGNCHAGAMATPVPPGDGVAQFGTIHGTSQKFGIGVNGSSGTRLAYRFTNGNSMRYYDPNGWTGSSSTCYTLSSGSTDSFGGCTKHSGGQGLSKPTPGQRPIKY